MVGIRPVTGRKAHKTGYLMIIDALLLALLAGVAPKAYSEYQAAKEFKASKPTYRGVILNYDDGILSQRPDEQVQEIGSIINSASPSPEHEDEESTLSLIINRYFGHAVDANVSTIKGGTRTERTWRYGPKGERVNDALIQVPLIDGVQKGIDGALQYKNLIIKYSEKYHLPEELVAAIIAVESEGIEGTSTAGAQGLMQLMPETARYYKLKIDDKLKIDERNDPEKNVDAGAHYLSDLFKRYGNNPMLVYVGYNWSDSKLDRLLKRKGLSRNPASVDWDQIKDDIPKETHAYALMVDSRRKMMLEDEITLK
jgi:soluble lytic murein transglycosylase